VANNQMIPVNLDKDSDDDVAWYGFADMGRLILDTIHGQIIIDIREHEVNAFTMVHGPREDHLLIRRPPRTVAG
jgi:hypothetical protein